MENRIGACRKVQIRTSGHTPAGHNTQGPPSGPVEPTPQLSEQTLAEIDPGGEVLPDSQSTHVADPEASLNFPAAQ